VTVERLRALHLSDEQIQKFEVLRRDIEKERVALEAQVKAAQQAAAAANAEAARLQGKLQTLLTQKIVKVLDSLMNEDQRKAWHQQDFTEQAKQWLQSHKGWLNRRCQARIVSGFTMPTTRRISFRPIASAASIRERRSSSVKRSRPLILDFGIRFSARRYSFWSVSSRHSIRATVAIRGSPAQLNRREPSCAT